MKKILVIDDDQSIRESLYDGLTLLGGYDVTLAEDGIDGIKEARQVTPDLIICDVDMPRLNGLEVIESLQEDSVLSLVPFVFLTAQGSREAVRHGMALGADDYISKPFDITELVDAIEARLSKASRLETHYDQKLESLRDNIITALPHELRTPLSIIVGYSEIMSNPDYELPAEKVASMARSIYDNGNRLHHLIENYINYAQIELISSDPERVTRLRQIREARPRPIIEDVAATQADKHGRMARLQIMVSDDPLPISSANLEKIVSELIDNAFKFSPASSDIAVLAKTFGDQFQFEVINGGRGMTAEQINSIGLYMQFERKIQEQQGSGTGLILARRLVELYGGKLLIHSTPDENTRVTVTLPR